jgi:hypothetical protein
VNFLSKLLLLLFLLFPFSQVQASCPTAKIHVEPQVSPKFYRIVNGKKQGVRYPLKPSILQLKYPGAEKLLCETLPKPKKALFILVDQTLGYDEEFIEEVKSKVLPWLKPGRFVEIITFSSNSGGKYTKSVLKLLMDPEIPENELIIRYLRPYQCLHPELLVAQKKTVEVYLERTMKEGNPSIPKSNIIETLKRVSYYVKEFPAEEKTVLVVSDMLQNSDITSFYYRNGVRLINPARELKKVEDAGLIGDFGGARIFVIGLGYNKKYLNKRKINLEKFWKAYFEKSNGRVVEIGTPFLLGDL